MDHDEIVEEILSDLVRLLNQGASAEDFSRRLARAESLPNVARRSGVVELVRMAMAVQNRLEFQQQRERGMLAVNESAQDLSSRLDWSGLLQAIVVRARKLLGSPVAWLSIYDAGSCEFKAVVADGALSESTVRMTAARDMGIASVVMSTRMPFTTADYLQDDRFPHDPALDHTFREEGIGAVVGVPLIWDRQVIGLLFVADRYHRTHDALSLSILSTLATHGAVAVKNAMAFEEANAALQKAEEARAQLESHMRHMHAAAEAHEQLTSLLARGAPLAELCQAIARLLGASVVVVDEAFRPVSRGAPPGHVAGAVERHLEEGPRAPKNAAIFRALADSRRVGRSVVASESGGQSCRVVAVIGGDDVLGALLLFTDRALDDMSIRTFERSASVVGIVLLSQERAEAAKTRDASELLRALVSFRQDDPALLQDRAERFGVDLTQPLALMLVEVDALESRYIARRLRIAEPLPHVLFDEIDGAIAILCAATRAREVARTFAALASREFGAGHRGVVSRPFATPAEIPALHATLRRALGVLKRIGIRDHIVGQNEMALYSVLFETHDQASLQTFLGATIGALIAHDERRHSALTATLLCYFDQNQSAKDTAAALGIHVNTVRQRLATIEDLLGHWGSAVRALEIHMALRLWGLSRTAGEISAPP